MAKKIKKGDKVYTKKGKRDQKNPGQLIVEDADRTWLQYDAVLCRSRKTGRNRLYLKHNLYTK